MIDNRVRKDLVNASLYVFYLGIFEVKGFRQK